MASRSHQRSLIGLASDAGVGEDVVVDHPHGSLTRPARRQIQPLTLDEAAVGRSLGIVVAVPTASPTGDRHLEVDLQEDRGVPQLAKLGPVEEDAVDDKHLDVGHRLGNSFDGLLGVDVVDAPHDPTLTRTRQLFEQQTPKRVVVVRVDEEPLQRVAAEPVPDRRWVVESVRRRSKDSGGQVVQGPAAAIGALLGSLDRSPSDSVLTVEEDCAQRP